MALRARLAILLALALIPLAAAGCGGSGGGGDASSPLDASLSYLPKSAPLVIAFDTDLKGSQYKNLQRLLGKFPFSGAIKREIVASIENGSSKVDFDRDLKPQLGNEVVIGATDVRSLKSDDERFVVAVKAKDEGKLESLLKKDGDKKTGTKSGAQLYKSKDGDDAFAIEDGVFLGASSKSVLEQALERRDGDDHLTADDFNKSVEGLPKGAAARLYADLGQVLKDDPGSRDALKSRWVSAVDTLGATASAESDGVKLDFKVKTRGDLSDSDLPLASGDQAPGLLPPQSGRFSFGLRGADQVLEFAQRTAQAINPAQFADFETAKQQIESRLGIDLDQDLIGQFNGDTSALVGIDGRFGARAELKDASAFEDTLRKAGPVLQSAAGSVGGPGAKIERPRKAGKGLYQFTSPGRDPIVFGVVKGVFVVARDRAEATALATRRPSAASGAKGAFAVHADANGLARQAIARLGGGGSGLNIGSALIAGPFGQVLGSVRADPDGLTGSFKLGID